MTCELCSDPGCQGPSSDPNDPHYDATDFAHPAWWRGHDHTVAALCLHINALLDDPGRADRGTASGAWEPTRQRIARMARDLNAARMRIAELERLLADDWARANFPHYWKEARDRALLMANEDTRPIER